MIQKYNLPKIDKINIAIIILFGSISFMSFGSGFAIFLIKEKISAPFFISIIILFKKIGRLSADIPLGIMADLKGTKKILTLSSTLSVLNVFLLFSGVLPLMVLSMIVYGFTLACRAGKIEAQLYNILKKNNKPELYTKILAVYYFISDLLLGLAAYLSGDIYNKFGKNGVMIASMISGIIPLILIYFFKQQDYIEVIKKQKPKLSVFIKELMSFIINNKIIFWLIAIFSICNFFSFQFARIVDLAMLDLAIPVQIVTKVHGISAIMMAIGSVMAFFISGKVSVKFSTILVLLFTIIIGLSALYSDVISIEIFFGAVPLLGIASVIYAFCYSTIELSICQALEDLTISKVRFSITSMTTLFSGIVNAAALLSIALLSRHTNNYSAAIGFFCIILMFIQLSAIFSLARYNVFNKLKQLKT